MVTVTCDFPAAFLPFSIFFLSFLLYVVDITQDSQIIQIFMLNHRFVIPLS